MKFILYISLCSMTANSCLEPVTHKEVFDDWKSCVVVALNTSKNIIDKLDLDDVNNLKLSTQYSCQEIKEI